MSALKEVISAATEEFATAIIAAIRGASFDEIAETSEDAPASSGGGGYRVRGKTASKASGKGKRIRRSQDDIQGVVDKIVAFVKKHKDGVSAEAIREELGVERKELPRPIAEALGQKLISKRGHKRATMYFAGSKASAAKKSVKKASKPKVKAASKKSGKKSAKKSAKKSGKKLSAKKNHKKMNGASKKAAVAAHVTTSPPTSAE